MLKYLFILTVFASLSFASPIWHVIISGDTLYDLALRYGTSVDSLISLNPTVKANFLQIGSRIQIKSNNNRKDGNDHHRHTENNSPDVQIKDSSSGKNIITFQEFQAILSCRPGSASDATHEKYEIIIDQCEIMGGISSKQELAMFLTHILHESDGLRAREEYLCANGANRETCIQHYGQSITSGHTYHGRGYIQTSHIYNYRAFSEAYFGDDRLVHDPTPVALVEELAWASAFFYWKSAVHLDAITGQFGRTTRAINGALECKGNGQSAKHGHEFTAHTRFRLYQKILLAMGIKETPNSDGCIP